MCSSLCWGYLDGVGVHFCGRFRSFDDCVSAMRQIKDCRSHNARFILLPCGKCLSCRMSAARDWAFRCECELATSGSAYFLTLTYDDSHLPFVNGVPSLEKRHYQLFLKRLRKSLDGQRISYFGCGEYGSRSSRPHYHFIIFGDVPSDLSVWSRTPKGSLLYRSPSLEKLWVDDDEKSLGFSSVGVCNPQTIDYVCRYSLKKISQDVSAFPVPPFTASSRRPALGLKWWESFGHSLIRFRADGSCFGSSCVFRGREIPIPRYFLKKLFQDSSFSDEKLSSLIHFRNASLLQSTSETLPDLLSSRSSDLADLSVDRFLSFSSSLTSSGL